MLGKMAISFGPARRCRDGRFVRLLRDWSWFRDGELRKQAEDNAVTFVKNLVT
jgi:hypothetical protein